MPLFWVEGLIPHDYDSKIEAEQRAKERVVTPCWMPDGG